MYFFTKASDIKISQINSENADIRHVGKPLDITIGLGARVWLEAISKVPISAIKYC